MTKMIATITYLREAAAKLNMAADRLEAQDGHHLSHAMWSISQAVTDSERCIRQIDRAQVEMADRLRAQTTGTLRS